MMILCANCGELAVDEDDEVCKSCGVVIETIQFGSEYVQPKPSVHYTPNRWGASIVKKQKPCIALTFGFTILKNLCHVFNIPSEKEYEVTDMLKSVYESKQRFKSKEDVGILGGCCLFLLQRKNNQPISIREMCNKLQCTMKRFSQILKYLKLWLSSNKNYFRVIGEEDGILSHYEEEIKHTDTDLPESAKSLIPIICNKISDENMEKLMKKTTELVKLAYKCWLLTGRSPWSIVTSCAFLCWKAMNPQRRKISLGKFCTEFSISGYHLANLRLPELKRMLLELGNKIPSRTINYVNKKNLLFHLDTILENSETLLNDLLPDALTEEALNCKEYMTFRVTTRKPPRVEPKTAIKYDLDMRASDIEISETEIELYIKDDNQKNITEKLRSNFMKCSVDCSV